MDLNVYLTELREYSNFSREELAERIKASATLIYDTETGKRTPTLKTLRLYSNFFEIPIENLIHYQKTNDISNLGKYQDFQYVIDHKKQVMKETAEPVNSDFIYNSVPHYESIEDYMAGTPKTKRHLFLRREFESDFNHNAIWTIPYFGEEVNQLFLPTDTLVINSGAPIQNDDLIVYQYKDNHRVFFGIRKYIKLPKEDKTILLRSYSNSDKFFDIMLSEQHFKKYFTIFGKIIFSYKMFY